MFSGVYGRNSDAQIFIDINDITELRSHLLTDESLVVGAGMTITDAIKIMRKTSKTAGFAYLDRVATHMQMVGNIAVRNVS